jgi:DNA-binding SARP family transcriptional activator
MVMGYIRIFAGHTALAKMYLEQAASLIHHSEVGTFNRLAIRMMLFNFLFHNGDFSNYFVQKNQLIDAFGLDLVAQSIAGPFCYIWEMDIALNQGNTARVLKLADEALAQQPSFSPHLTSQILQLRGVALALQGQKDQALAAAIESRQLRELAGGPYFITLNKLIVGLTHGLCGLHQQGIDLLDEGIADARRMPTEYLEACGLFHRAEVLLDAGQDQSARRDLECGIRLLHRNSYYHFWAWHPRAMARSLALAVEHGYERAFARRLANYRLHLSLLDDGSAIQQLDIQVLGGIRVIRQGVPLLEAENLTPTQRELLALLLAAPGLKMPQESICLHFWPDSSLDTVRIKFDTLISRLRKTLADALPDNTASLYLNREKGMIWLAHCRTDAHRFLEGAKKGMIHYRLQEFWQADNIFTSIEPLWQGEFAPGVTGDDRMRFFRDSLNTALSEMAIVWSDLLVRSDRLADAIGVVNKALLYDPLNDRLYTLLYRLEGQRSAAHARRVLDRFKSVLLQEGFYDDEIAELVRVVASSRPKHSPASW